MSLPNDLLAGKGPRSNRSTPGLGLESLNADETEEFLEMVTGFAMERDRMASRPETLARALI